MKLVEQHCISKGDARYEIIDRAAFVSKNLYNAANYELRQAYILQKVYLRYEELYHLMKSHEAYKALPAKVAQQVLKTLDKNWKGYLAACLVWQKHPEKLLGRPKLPKYKNKEKGRNILVYTIQAISKNGLKRGVIQPSGLAIEIQTKQTDLAQVRIVPRSRFYVVEVVYEAKEAQADVDASLIAGIDTG